MRTWWVLHSQWIAITSIEFASATAYQYHWGRPQRLHSKPQGFLNVLDKCVLNVLDNVMFNVFNFSFANQRGSWHVDLDSRPWNRSALPWERCGHCSHHRRTCPSVMSQLGLSGNDNDITRTGVWWYPDLSRANASVIICQNSSRFLLTEDVIIHADEMHCQKRTQIDSNRT